MVSRRPDPARRHHHTRAPVVAWLRGQHRSGPPPAASHRHQRAALVDWLRGFRRGPRPLERGLDHRHAHAPVADWLRTRRERRRLKRFVEGPTPHPHASAPVLELISSWRAGSGSAAERRSASERRGR